MEVTEVVEEADQPHISITLDAKTWKALLDVFKQVNEEISLLRDGDRPMLYGLDKGHVFLCQTSLSAKVEGEASEGVVFVEDVYDFVRRLDEKTAATYTFKPLKDGECEVSMYAEEQVVETFRRGYSITEPLSIEYGCSAECSTNVKTLKQLFSLFDDISAVKIMINGGRLTVWNKEDDQETQVSAYVNASGSDWGLYTGYIVANIVKHLPNTALAKMALYTPNTRQNSHSRILGITAYYQQHEIWFLIAPRIEDWEGR